MPDTETASPFPLPMVAFERYMLADDRPEYPMTFPLTLRLSGRVDRDAFAAAMEETVARHPMLRALVDLSVRRRPRWVLDGRARPPLDWNQEGAPLVCPRGEAIDLSREPGLRVWVRQGDGKAQVTFQFHHACCDGVGAVQFIGDVLASYASRTGPQGNRPVLQPLDAGRLRTRGTFARRRASWMGRVASLLGTLGQAAKFGSQRPAPLETPAERPVSGPAGPLSGLCWRELEETPSQRLRDLARRHDATVNDLLLRDMFLTVAAWNRRWRKGSRREWLRVLMPANLREPGDERMPAANVVSMSFLSRRAGSCENAQELLDGIRDETTSVKRSRRGLHFIQTIELAQAICGVMPGPLVGDRCFTTVVLSNLGDITRWFASTFPEESGRLVVGDLVLEGITGAPPVRPKTSAAFLICRYAGRTIVNLRYDPRRFTAQHANDLLEDYVGRLARTSEEAG